MTLRTAADFDVALAELVRHELIYDSGERRDGLIVWKVTEKGKRFAEIEALLSFKPTGDAS
jgi:hypothetical protein